MPFGAHETMEAHEILTEKINMINHFNLYRQHCRDQVLRQMIDRHLDSAIRSYNQLVSYTHDYQPITHESAAMQNNPMRYVQGVNQVQYGLNQPAPQLPQMTAAALNDQQIAAAMLSWHKNSAKNNMTGALECADPNVRQMMINGAVACANEAYEVFRYMNQHGYYQVPTMESHTAKTMLHSYQPVQQYGVAGDYMQTMQ